MLLNTRGGSAAGQLWVIFPLCAKDLRTVNVTPFPDMGADWPQR